MRLTTWGVLLLVGIASPALGQDALAWKFKAGTAFTLERVHQQKQAVELKGKTQRQESTTTWITRLDVRQASAKEFVLDQTIVSVAVKETVPDVKLPAWTEKIKGARFRVTLSPAGRVRKFEGYEAFVKKLDTPGQEESIRHLLPETTLRGSLEEMLGFLPETREQLGAGWQREAVEPIAPFGSLKTIFDYTLDGRDQKATKIICTVQASYVRPTIDLGVLHVVNGTAKAEHGKGVVLFDSQMGLLIRGEQQVRIRGVLTVETVPRQTDELTFVSETRDNWRLVEINPQ